MKGTRGGLEEERIVWKRHVLEGSHLPNRQYESEEEVGGKIL